MKRKYRPGIRTILLLVNLAVLVLPLGGLVFFRIYENQLVRETEAELIAQAAVVGALYRHAVAATLNPGPAFGRPRTAPSQVPPGERYTPLPPRIDLAVEPILPRRADAQPADVSPTAEVLRLGGDVGRMFETAQLTTLAGFRLLDHNGVVIGGRGEIGLSLGHVHEVARALEGRTIAVLRQRALDAPKPPLASISRGTGVRIFLAYPVVEGARVWGVVYLSRTPNNILKHMYASRDRFVVLGLAIVAVTMALAWITSRTIGQPVDALADQAGRLARGEPEALAVLPHYGTREAAILGQSFIDMATALEARSAYLRDFASHVSHEFKTPLTAIRGAAELLGEHIDAMPPADRQRFLGNIVADTERLQALVTGLLALARADNTEPETGQIALVATLEKACGSGEPMGLAVTVEGPAEAAARISADNLAVVARNLMANAAEAGANRIAFAVSPQGDGWRIRVTDNGRGISDGNRARIFQPFFTTRRDVGGTGLGLRIIQSVMRAHRGSIALAATGPSGTTFEIHLPASIEKQIV